MENNNTSSIKPLDTKGAEWKNVEAECALKINENLQHIANYRERSGQVGLSLKTRYDRKVDEMEVKNSQLLQQIDSFKKLRTTDLAEFNLKQNTNLHRFKAAFKSKLEELV